MYRSREDRDFAGGGECSARIFQFLLGTKLFCICVNKPL